MELRVWIGTVQRIISGLSEKTTSHDVIVALAQATGKTGRFTLVEKWRDYEKTLTPNECPLVVAQKFGDYAHEVQFILRQTGETSQNRRLAEAKSPKPQRRRAAIKKSLSFSGGAQSVSPSQSPRLRPVHAGIAEEEHSAELNYVTPQPRKSVPQPHPADMTTTSTKSVSTTDKVDSPVDTLLQEPPEQPKTRQTSSSSTSSSHRHDRSRKSKSRDRARSSEKPESNSKAEVRRQREAELMQREMLELQQTITNHERRLEEEKRKLHNIDRDISTVTVEEERKWSKLYDCRDEINKALTTVQHLDIELDDFDEVLLSEEINVLLLRQQEMREEMADVQRKVENCELHLSQGREQSKILLDQLEELNQENNELDSTISNNEEELYKLQKRVDEKKRFLLEAEDGYMSACDDLKEADNSLEKRKQMLVELERELREYNLKTFINTGFSEKYNPGLRNRANPKTRGLLV